MNRRGLLFFLVGFGGMLAAGWFGFPALLYRPVEQQVQFSHKVHAVDGGHTIPESGILLRQFPELRFVQGIRLYREDIPARNELHEASSRVTAIGAEIEEQPGRPAGG